MYLSGQMYMVQNKITQFSAHPFAKKKQNNRLNSVYLNNVPETEAINQPNE